MNKNNTDMKTLREFMHDLNLAELAEEGMGDEDVFVDGFEPVAICAPVYITEEGEKEFKVALEAPIQHTEDCGWFISCDTEEQDEEAFGLIGALAGLCSEANWEKWFSETNGKLI